MTATIAEAKLAESSRSRAPDRGPSEKQVPPLAADGERTSAPSAPRTATDDEILGLDSALNPGPRTNPIESDSDTDPALTTAKDVPWEVGPKAQTSNLEAIFTANPELRRAWEDANLYRESFATPELARTASAALADLDRIDALFFSGRREDHAELARAVAALDPTAFKSLAEAMAQIAAAEGQGVAAGHVTPQDSMQSSARNAFVVAGPRVGLPNDSPRSDAASHSANPAAPAQPPQPTPTQQAFFNSANDAAVRAVIDAIEGQVQRLLPEGISKGARNRLVGEIYRELDSTLRSSRQFGQQAREAFRSGGFDDDHRAAIVSLIAGRARQALPAVAKRVLNEWTSTIVAANQDHRARQRAAERRIDIAGSGRTGNDGRKPITRHDIDYARMSDADILNLC